MHFTKMHGLGNDYLYMFGELEDPAAVSIKWSERHFGIGSDGIILISPSTIADFKMRIFNADGSEAKMCGNGIRCVGKFVYDKGYTEKTNLSIETMSGIRTLQLTTSGGKVKAATVNMGQSVVSEDLTITALGQEVTLTPTSMGNPHAVIFTEDAENAPLTTLGAAIERHEAFPDGVNVEFVQKLDDTTLRMRVWERGSGITMACGTGACASVAAAVRHGLVPADQEITVKLDGGNLRILVASDGMVTMTGPAKTVCECEVDDE